jgi:hypothetical protein
MRRFGIAAFVIVLTPVPALAQEGGYYNDYGREAPQAQDGDWRGDDIRDDDDRREEWRDQRRADDGWDPAAVRTEDQAVDACAVAAENEGREHAGNARVVDITKINRDSRGWVVEGTLALRSGWRDRAREERFRCAVTFEGLRDARIAGLDDNWR